MWTDRQRRTLDDGVASGTVYWEKGKGILKNAELYLKFVEKY